MKSSLVLALVLLVCFGALHGQDGALDTSFGSDGIVTMDIDNSNDAMKSILTQTDGKIIVAGYTTDTIADKFCLVRFNIDGTVDNSFGMDGVVTTTFASTSIASDIALQSDDKIVVAGHTWGGSENHFALARYNPDGSLDTSFGENGTVSSSFPGKYAIARALAIQGDGKIIVGGQVYTLNNDFDEFALARYETNGSLDATFGTGGQVTTSFGEGTQNWINAIELQENGKIVAGGFSNDLCALARYNENGTLDPTFGNSGLVTTWIPNTTQGIINALAIDSNGGIFGGGFSVDAYSNFTVVKYDSSGMLDNTFGVNGIVVTQLSPEQDAIADILLQADNKLLVAGSTNENSIFQFALARFDGAGNPDPTFGTNGVVKTLVNPHPNILQAITLQSDGKILATGFIDEYPYDIGIVRYSSTVLSTADYGKSIDNISVYPNPAANWVEIAYTLKQKEDVTIQLLDSQARVLQERLIPFKTTGVNNTEAFDLETHSAGIYFISIGTMGVSQIVKIVKE